MVLVPWDRRYSVGVAVLDDQHRILVGILNDFHAAMISGRGESSAGPLLCRLQEHVSKHFPAEEKLMESAKFPGLAKHREYHRNLCEKVEEFVARHKKGDHGMYISLLYFLREWQKQHLLLHDREYIPYMAEAGIS